MYRIEQDENGLRLYWGEHLVFGGVKPQLLLEQGVQVPLELQEFTQDKHSAAAVYAAGGENEEIRCTISLRIEGDWLSCQMSGEAVHEVSYDARAFDPEQGIGLIVGAVPHEGKLLGHYRHNLWWTRKVHAEQPSALPPRTQSMLWENAGTYFHLFPLSDHGLVSELGGCEEGLRICASAHTSGMLRFSAQIFTLVCGKDPYALGTETARAVEQVLPGKRRSAEQRRYPEVFEYLGWCSWNAFYDRVCEAGVLEKADEFQEKGVPVRWFLIDHGWSEERDGQLYSFYEDRKKFPSGLKQLKQQLARRGVRWLGLWQGMGGHWGTIDQDSPLARERAYLLFRTNGGELIPAPDRTKAFAFWDEWHGYLASQGVDFVKVDIQSSLSVFAKGRMQTQTAAEEAHRGLEASIGVHFDGQCINSMGMATETILSRPVTGVSRNSNDFFPNRVNSFSVHACDNAYNALYHGAFYHGDWDMWWTDHVDAQNNAYLRALSGGPVYVSDCLHETIAAALRPLILSDGRVLRCPQPGTVTPDELFDDPTERGSAFRVWNCCQGTGYLGVFALAGLAPRQKAEISPEDIPALEEAREYLMRRHGTAGGQLVGKNTRVATELEAGKSALYSVTPLKNHLAFLGLLDKYIGAASIREAVYWAGGAAYVVCESGRIGYACPVPHTVLVNGAEMTPRREEALCVLDLPEGPEPVHVEIRFL